MSKRITITIPDHLMDRVDTFCKLHAKNQDMSDAAKLRFLLSYGLREYIPQGEVEVKHGGKRQGAGRKKESTE